MRRLPGPTGPSSLDVAVDVNARAAPTPAYRSLASARHEPARTSGSTATGEPVVNAQAVLAGAQAPVAKRATSVGSMNASSAPIVRAVGLQHEEAVRFVAVVHRQRRPPVRARRAEPDAARDPARAGVVEEPHDLHGPVHRAARWHPQHGVLAQQRDERIHVGALPGVDVALEQLALRRGGGRGRERRELCARSSPARAGARCSRRRRWCRAARRPRARSSRARRAGSTRRAGGRAGTGSRSGTRAPSPRAARSAPRDRTPARRSARRARRGRLHGRGPARAALELVQAGVGRDPVEPGLDRRAALEALEPAPGAQQRLLHDVLGVLGRAEHPVAVDLEGAAVAARRAAGRRARRRRERPRRAPARRLSRSCSYSVRRGAGRELIDEVAALRPSNTSSTRTARSIR